MGDLLTSHSHKIRLYFAPLVRGKVDVSACRQTERIYPQYLGNTLVPRHLSRHCTWRRDADSRERAARSRAWCTSSSTKLVHNLAATLSDARPFVPRGTDLLN